MSKPFKMRSGNSPMFKYMGSSPVEMHEGGKEHMTQEEEDAHKAIDAKIAESNRKDAADRSDKESARSKKRQEATAERTRRRSEYLAQEQERKDREEKGGVKGVVTGVLEGFTETPRKLKDALTKGIKDIF